MLYYASASSFASSVLPYIVYTLHLHEQVTMSVDELQFCVTILGMNLAFILRLSFFFMQGLRSYRVAVMAVACLK